MQQQAGAGADPRRPERIVRYVSPQAVVAASTQGEDRKEAPSDDLTPGACLLMLALWNVEVPQRPTGGDYGGRQTVQEAIVATICKPFRNTMDHTLWQ